MAFVVTDGAEQTVGGLNLEHHPEGEERVVALRALFERIAKVMMPEAVVMVQVVMPRQRQRELRYQLGGFANIAGQQFAPNQLDQEGFNAMVRELLGQRG